MSSQTRSEGKSRIKKTRNESSFPIFRYKEEILRYVRTSQLTIITGETGCGKSTQVPQYLVDKLRARKVAVTTPTRISAISLSKFVAECRRSSLGEEIGYSIGGDKQKSHDTKIEFQTVGVLKEKLINRGNLRASHVIIDEVHERTIDVDTVLYLVKKLLRLDRSIRIILMSATISQQTFAKYFQELPQFDRIPHVHVPTRAKDVKIHYLLDVLTYCETEWNPQEFRKHIKRELHYDRPRLLPEIEEFGVNLISDLHKDESKYGRYSFLVFLPGIAEINLFQRELISSKLSFQEVQIHILHSSIPVQEQKAIFRPSNKRKIILSTNIAESSITIPDVKVVIDFCLFKEMNVNFHNGAEELRMNWASQESITQRSGRAGRIRSGVCFRMIPRDFYQYQLKREITPEILRVSLAHLILKFLKIRINFPENILKRFITPPNMDNITRAYCDLEEFGAVYEDSRKITKRGHFFVDFPLNLNNSTLVYLGLSFGYLNECVVLACILDVGGLMYRASRRPISQLRKTFKAASFHRSDVIASYLVFGQWVSDHAGSMIIDSDSRRAFCVKNGVSIKKLEEVESRIEMVIEKLSNHYPNLKLGKTSFSFDTDREVLDFVCLLIGIAYLNNIVVVSHSKDKELPVGFDVNRTAHLELNERCKNSHLCEERIRKFVDLGGYEGGFGKISDHVLMKVPNRENEQISVNGIYCAEGSKDVFVQFDSEFAEEEHDDHKREREIMMFRPIQLMNKINNHQFAKMPFDAGRRFMEMPYNKAKGPKKIYFQGLFFSERMKVSRFSILDNYLTPLEFRVNLLEYTFCFASHTSVNNGSLLFLDNCTILPAIRGLKEILFLCFGKKVKKSETKKGYMEMIFNDTIYYFKPIVTTEVRKRVNALRKYMDSVLHKFLFRRAKLAEIEKKQVVARNHLRRLLLLYEDEYENYWDTLKKKVTKRENKKKQEFHYYFRQDEKYILYLKEHLKIREDLDSELHEFRFLKNKYQIRKMKIRRITIQILQYIPFLSSTGICLIIHLLNIYEDRKKSHFFHLSRLIKTQGYSLSFFFTNSFGISVQKIEPGKKLVVPKSQRLMTKESEIVFSKMIQKVEQEYHSIKTTKESGRIKMFPKEGFAVIPFCVMTDPLIRSKQNIYYLVQKNTCSVIFKDRDRSETLKDDAAMVLSTMIFNKIYGKKDGFVELLRKRDEVGSGFHIIKRINFSIVLFPIPYISKKEMNEKGVLEFEYKEYKKESLLTPPMNIIHFFYYQISRTIRHILKNRSDIVCGRIARLTSKNGLKHHYPLSFIPPFGEKVEFRKHKITIPDLKRNLIMMINYRQNKINHNKIKNSVFKMRIQIVKYERNYHYISKLFGELNRILVSGIKCLSPNKFFEIKKPDEFNPYFIINTTLHKNTKNFPTLKILQYIGEENMFGRYFKKFIVCSLFVHFYFKDEIESRISQFPELNFYFRIRIREYEIIDEIYKKQDKNNFFNRFTIRKEKNKKKNKKKKDDDEEEKEEEEIYDDEKKKMEILLRSGKFMMSMDLFEFQNFFLPNLVHTTMKKILSQGQVMCQKITFKFDFETEENMMDDKKEYIELVMNTRMQIYYKEKLVNILFQFEKDWKRRFVCLMEMKFSEEWRDKMNKNLEKKKNEKKDEYNENLDLPGMEGIENDEWLKKCKEKIEIIEKREEKYMEGMRLILSKREIMRALPIVNTGPPEDTLPPSGSLPPLPPLPAPLPGVPRNLDSKGDVKKGKRRNKFDEYENRAPDDPYAPSDDVVASKRYYERQKEIEKNKKVDTTLISEVYNDSDFTTYKRKEPRNNYYRDSNNNYNGRGRYNDYNNNNGRYNDDYRNNNGRNNSSDDNYDNRRNNRNDFREEEDRKNTKTKTEEKEEENKTKDKKKTDFFSTSDSEEEFKEQRSKKKKEVKEKIIDNFESEYEGMSFEVYKRRKRRNEYYYHHHSDNYNNYNNRNYRDEERDDRYYSNNNNRNNRNYNNEEEESESASSRRRINNNNNNRKSYYGTPEKKEKLNTSTEEEEEESEEIEEIEESYEDLFPRLSSSQKSEEVEKKNKSKVFSPPLEIMYSGEFSEGQEQSKSEKKWILLNIIHGDFLSCFRMNRDIWSNLELQKFVSENYIYFQKDVAKLEEVNFISNLEISSRNKEFSEYPYFGIFNPFNLVELERWEGEMSLEELLEKLNKFVEEKVFPEVTKEEEKEKEEEEEKEESIIKDEEREENIIKDEEKEEIEEIEEIEGEDNNNNLEEEENENEEKKKRKINEEIESEGEEVAINFEIAGIMDDIEEKKKSQIKTESEVFENEEDIITEIGVIIEGKGKGKEEKKEEVKEIEEIEGEGEDEDENNDDDNNNKEEGEEEKKEKKVKHEHPKIKNFFFKNNEEDKEDYVKNEIIDDLERLKELEEEEEEDDLDERNKYLPKPEEEEDDDDEESLIIIVNDTSEEEEEEEERKKEKNINFEELDGIFHEKTKNEYKDVEETEEPVRRDYSRKRRKKQMGVEGEELFLHNLLKTEDFGYINARKKKKRRKKKKKKKRKKKNAVFKGKEYTVDPEEEKKIIDGFLKNIE